MSKAKWQNTFPVIPSERWYLLSLVVTDKSNRTDRFYRWLHFITWRIHADWKSCCLASVQCSQLVCSFPKHTPSTPQTTSKWSTTQIKSFSFSFATCYTWIIIVGWLLIYGKIPSQLCLRVMIMLRGTAMRWKSRNEILQKVKLIKNCLVSFPN